MNVCHKHGRIMLHDGSCHECRNENMKYEISARFLTEHEMAKPVREEPAPWGTLPYDHLFSKAPVRPQEARSDVLPTEAELYARDIMFRTKNA